MSRAGRALADRWPLRDGTFTSPLHDERLAARLGAALGVAFTICFATGLVSHLVQEPGGFAAWPARPAGLYRLTQGLHVTTGLASIPLLAAKLWVVYPKLFQWPPVRSAAQAVERLALLPMIGASLLLVLTGLGNINIYRPWDFSFRAGHLAAAWIAIGGLVLHATAKAATTWTHLRPARRGATTTATAPSEDDLDRRGFLVAVLGASGAAALLTVGQTFAPLRRLALLSPRRPDVGPQGFPVNRTAASVQLDDLDVEAWRLVVDGPATAVRLELTYDDLRALPQRTATLPIACVEGWSTSQTWTGVPIRALLDLAGVDDVGSVEVVSVQRSTRQQRTTLQRAHATDRDALLALEVNGEPLHPDHGFPARLMVPNLPGVHQIKWVGRLEVAT